MHVTFDALSNRGAGTSSFSGLPLGPPSINGWSACEVTKSLRDYVAVKPRIHQRIHQAVDRNPWSQTSEETNPFSSALDRKSVAVWVIKLPSIYVYNQSTAGKQGARLLKFRTSQQGRSRRRVTSAVRIPVRQRARITAHKAAVDEKQVSFLKLFCLTFSGKGGWEWGGWAPFSGDCGPLGPHLRCGPQKRVPGPQ